MKKFSVFVSFVLAFILLVLAFSPVSAATLTLNMVQVRGSGVFLYIDVSGDLTGGLNTFAYVLFDAYPVACGYNENVGVLVCRMDGGIARKHAGQTAFIILDGQKVFFTIPELHSHPSSNPPQQPPQQPPPEPE